MLFNIMHECGNFDEYDGGNAGAHFTITAAAALGNTNYGMSVLIDDQENRYARKDVTAPASNEIRYRFYVDPNELTMGNGDVFGIHRLGLSIVDPIDTIHGVGLGYSNVNGYGVRQLPRDDSGQLATHDTWITDAPHYVEVHIERASSAVAADGRVRAWVDGVLVQTWANVDNYDVFPYLAQFRWGADGGIDATTSGTFYLDEFECNDSGGEIGPVRYVEALRRREGY